jgi:hypothetical protein
MRIADCGLQNKNPNQPSAATIFEMVDMRAGLLAESKEHSLREKKQSHDSGFKFCRCSATKEMAC